jgi:hypothetical protein
VIEGLKAPPMKLELHICDSDGDHTDLSIPLVRTAERDYCDKLPQQLLQQIIDGGLFGSHLDPSHLRKWRKAGNRNPQLFGALDRKALAIKLVLGLLVSLESGYAIPTWDPQRIFFLSLKDGTDEIRNKPYVLCDRIDDANRELLTLPAASLVLLDGDRPFYPVFALLAKVLLHIAVGGSNEDSATMTKCEMNQDDFNDLQENIQYYATTYRGALFEQPPFVHSARILAAAQSCLLFSAFYKREITALRSDSGNSTQKNSLVIAQKLIYEKILFAIDNTLPRATFLVNITEKALLRTDTGDSNHAREPENGDLTVHGGSLFDEAENTNPE